jgi:hypothetical protein
LFLALLAFRDLWVLRVLPALPALFPVLLEILAIPVQQEKLAPKDLKVRLVPQVLQGVLALPL